MYFKKHHLKNKTKNNSFRKLDLILFQLNSQHFWFLINLN